MLNRAYKVCSTWPSFHQEIIRLKQLFTNNNFPFATIEAAIKKFLDKKRAPHPQENANYNVTNFFYRSQMNSQYKQDENNLTRIINNNIQPVANNKIKLCIYYKNRKLSQLLIKNNINPTPDDNHVVYAYTCPKAECQPAKLYVGYTQTSLKQRVIMHAQSGSILSHNIQTHQHKIKTKEILEHTTVIYKSPHKQELQLAEALYIKQLSPALNNQREGLHLILKVF